MNRPAIRVWPRSARGWMYSDLNALYRTHMGRRALRGGEVGAKTRRERRVVIEAALRGLHEAGFKLRRLRNFREKHLDRIVSRWREEQLLPSTQATYISHLRTLCRWLDKPQLVAWLDRYVSLAPELTRRSTVALTDRSPRGVGVDSPDIIRRALEIDTRFACQLSLIAVFGLRSQEAWLFRPHLAEYIPNQVQVIWGTKGSRPRVIPGPLTSAQRAVLEWAKTFAATPAESMVPRGMSVQQWRGRYYRWCARIGLTRAGLKVTPHSLRHEVLLDIYECLTGVPAPVRGGTLGQSDPPADQAARTHVALVAGHNRPSVSSAYLGSVRPAATVSRCDTARKNAPLEG